MIDFFLYLSILEEGRAQLMKSQCGIRLLRLVQTCLLKFCVHPKPFPILCLLDGLLFLQWRLRGLRVVFPCLFIGQRWHILTLIWTVLQMNLQILNTHLIE
jgi:hypothetical protein